MTYAVSTDAVIHIVRTLSHVANFQITSPKAQLFHTRPSNLFKIFSVSCYLLVRS